MTPLQSLQLRKLRRIVDDLSELAFETFDEENDTPDSISSLLASASNKVEDAKQKLQKQTYAAVDEMMTVAAKDMGVEIDPATIRVIRPQGVSA